MWKMGNNNHPDWIKEKLENNISYQILQEKISINNIIDSLLVLKNNDSFKYEFKETMVSNINTLKKWAAYLSFSTEIDSIYKEVEAISKLSTDKEIPMQEEILNRFIDILRLMETHLNASLWDSLKDDVKDMEASYKINQDFFSNALTKILNGPNNENLN